MHLSKEYLHLDLNIVIYNTTLKLVPYLIAVLFYCCSSIVAVYDNCKMCISVRPLLSSRLMSTEQQCSVYRMNHAGGSMGLNVCFVAWKKPTSNLAEVDKNSQLECLCYASLCSC